MSAKEAKPRTKLVVRKLPAQLTREQFQQSIERFLPNVDWWYFVPGKITDKKTFDSRAYLNFSTVEALTPFVKHFNGHVFLTNKGKEMRAEVMFAPYQKVPNTLKPKKVDTREGTIDTDPEYLKFLESLKEPVVSLPSAEEQLDRRLEKEKEQPPLPTTTPLLEYLKQKRAQRRGKRTKAVKEKGKDEKKVSRRKEREERRRKKKEEKQDQSDAKEAKPKKDDEKKKNGIWMIRKHLEPGAVTIQTREEQPQSPPTPAPSNATAKPEEETSTTQSSPSAQRAARKRGERGKPPAAKRGQPNRRGGRPEKERVKIYAPKQAGSTQ